jgi:NTE family protein
MPLDFFVVVHDDGSDSGVRRHLALQGGGVYGAFTWGVLDHVLEDGRLEIEGITGASAGAVNAIMLADGLARGGPGEARRRLRQAGDEWYVLARHPSGQREHVHRFKSETEAKNWIARKSKAWLRKRG